MIANQMYNIELSSDETFLSSSRNLLAITTIFQQAIEKHISIYNQKEIPLSFIEFYIDEIKNYSFMFRKTTKDFFEDYSKMNPSIETVANVYLKSFYSQATSLLNKNGEMTLQLPSTDITSYIDDIANNADKDIASLITNIIKVTEHINHNDEIIPFYENYENYLIRKVINSLEFVSGNKGKSKVIINVYDNTAKKHVIAASKKAERLTSERLNYAKQKGKVTKIVIPRLKLPSAYPKVASANRYNSKKRARNFISVSRQILIMNDLKINGVAYSNNFIEKRNAMNEAND